MRKSEHINIRISQELKRKAKIRSAQHRLTLTEVIVSLLENWLKKGKMYA